MNGSVKYFCQSDNKGQLISECLSGILNSPKKPPKKFYFTKGQLISKCPFGAIVSTKKSTKFF